MHEARNIGELLALRARASGNEIGLTFEDTQLTWKQVFERAQAVASVLANAGIGRGDVVGILAPHCPAQPAALFGVALAGAAFSIINPLLQPEQIEHQVNDAGMKGVLGTEELGEQVAAMLAGRAVPWFGLQTDGRPTADPQPCPPLPTAIPIDVANIIYTSGSTGRPKGVVVPHRTLLDGARIVSGYLGITDSDVTLSILPLGFDYGLNQILTAVRTGARLVMHHYVLPMDLLRVMAREQVTGLAAVPSLWPGLLRQLARMKEPAAFTELRYITTAGGAHSPELLQRLDDAFEGTEIIVMYGLTESFRSTYLPYSEVHRRPGCIGRPVPEVEILVMNDQGGRCGPDEKGELIHRGAFVNYGYRNNPELTAHRYMDLPGRGPGCLPEKAVRSGDLVSMSEDGYIYFHGRLDAQIKSRGYRISPDEVAGAVGKIEGVRQVVVFGLPDPVVGECVVAAYETHSGQEIPRREFNRALEGALPGYAHPRHYWLCPELPTTPNGKLDVTGVRRACARELNIAEQ